MPQELILCIPGDWKDSRDFIARTIHVTPEPRYLFAGNVLMDMQTDDHIQLDFCPADPNLSRAMEIAGQGRIPPAVLDQIQHHTSVVFLHFPLDMLDQRERILKYTQLLQRLGGLAIKLENTGIAHHWDRWYELLSGDLYDIYLASTVIVSSNDHYYSCGMQQFGLPECMVPRSISFAKAGELLGHFNLWQITAKPRLNSGETFSLTGDDIRYRLLHRADTNYEPESQFHNSHGLWQLLPC